MRKAIGLRMVRGLEVPPSTTLTVTDDREQTYTFECRAESSEWEPSGVIKLTFSRCLLTSVSDLEDQHLLRNVYKVTLTYEQKSGQLTFELEPQEG